MPAIALTGDTGAAVDETGREGGASRFLHKPFDPEQVRSLLDQRLGVEAPLEL